MKKLKIKKQFAQLKFCILPLILISCLFSGCTKIPEKSDIEEVINSIYEEIDQLCGNGELDPFEECDFSGYRKCSDYDSDFVGQISCTDCKLNRSNCFDKDFCSNVFCSSNGSCYENVLNEIYCKCSGGWIGTKCNECIDGSHFDIDGKCISSENCTLVGCEYENEKCRIVNKKSGRHAECFCNEPYAGEKCDECHSSYFLENGECLGRYCYNSNIKCEPYLEKCTDSSGKPVCVCVTETQNPENCMECLTDYIWSSDILSSKKCINEKFAQCTTNPDRPENSTDYIINHTVKYSDKNGWEDPPYCEWICIENYYSSDGKCNWIFAGTTNETIEFPIGVDNKGVFYAGSRSGNIFSLSEKNTHLIYSMEVSSSEGRIGTGSNIYFRTGNTFSIFDTENIAHLTLSNSGFSSSGKMTILKNGKVSFGHSYISGIDYHRLENSFNSTIVSDQDGNMLSIDRLSATFFDKDFNIIWNKQYENTTLGEYPVISKDGFSYIPCCYKLNQSICVVDTFTGEIEKAIDLKSLCENSIARYPSIAIDNDNNLFALNRGVLYSFDASGNLIFSTDLTIYSGNRSFATVTPVITDSGYIFFSNQAKVICIDIYGNLIWYYELGYYPEHLFHYDGVLYVFAKNRQMSKFYAPGNLSGEWPMFQKDYKLSGSLAEIDSTEKPSKPVIVTPGKDELIKDSNVLLSWNNSNKDLDHIVTIKKGNSDEILDGPSSVFTYTLDNLPLGNVIWKVASISPEGGVSIVSSKFSIISELEIWRFNSDKTFRGIPITVNYNDEIVVARTDDLLFISTKNNTHKSFSIDASKFKGTAANKEGVFFGFEGKNYFEINKGNYYSEALLGDYDSFSTPLISECNNQMIALYKNGSNLFLKSDKFDTPKFLFSTHLFYENPIINNHGLITSIKLLNIMGDVFNDTPCSPNGLFEDYFLCVNSNTNHSQAFLVNEDFGFELFPIISGITAPVVHNGEFYSAYFISNKCQIRASVPGENVESRTIFEWSCNSSNRPSVLVVSSDGTFFTFADKNILAIREGEGFILNEQVSNDKIFSITLTENGRLFLLTERKIFEIEHDAAGANPSEWSQHRGNSRRTGSVYTEECFLPPQ